MELAGSVEETASRRGAGYQTLLVGLLSLNFGILFFDRNALNFLMPFVKPSLGLSNTQVGLTASALSFSWALAALAVGAAADRTGRRKMFLIACTIAFSLCSFLTGLAQSFVMLFAARLLMGTVEGGVAPVSQTMIASAVPHARRGLAMGVMQNFCSNLLGSFAAPVLLVWFASTLGWHRAFFLAGIPGLISALLLWKFVDEPDAPPPRERNPLLAHVGELLANRNLVVCLLLSVLLVSYLVVCWAFMPLFLTKMRGFAPTTMSWLIGSLGISATIGSFAIAGLSDRIGRKPVMIATAFLGVVLPLGAMFFTGSVWVLAAIFALGWTLTGIFPLFMAAVPSESVAPQHVTTAMALVMGVGEVLGGVFSPTLAGWAADANGLTAPLWIMIGLCIAAGLLALILRETAPAAILTTTSRPQGVVALRDADR
ncbi:MAG TPA: MFS transporter [Rhizomicrobium sp.]